MKYHPKTKPFPHQAKATLRAVKERNHAIFFEPRLGKTKAALDYVGILALKGEVSRVLVLAPRIALSVWEDQIEEHYPHRYKAETFEEKWISDGNPFVFGDGYTRFFLAGREETFRAVRKGKKLVRPKQKILEEWGPDAIVVDESHEYKRPGGRGAQDAWRLVTRARKQRGAGDGRPFVLLLTGTPNPKGWRDLFAQFRIMDDSLLGTNAGSFDEEYCVYGQGARKYTILKYRNVRRLERIVHAHSSVCTAAQAGLEGELFFQRLTCELPPKVKEKYNEMAEEMATEVAGETLTAANQGVRRLRLLQITAGYLTDGRQIHSAKADALKAYSEQQIQANEALLVYCRFTGEVDAAERTLRGVGYRVGVLDGRTPRRNRAGIVSAFQDGRLTAIVAQVQAGSVAIELSRAAEVVFTTLPDGWVQFFQALNRVRGPNQHRPVRVSAIMARGTLDASVFTALQHKEDWHRTLMKDPYRFLMGGEVG